MNASDVIAYQYKDVIYCKQHIIDVLPTGDGEEFDGWALAPGADRMSVEDNLHEIAVAFGFHNTAHGSDEFPLPIFGYGDDLTDAIGQVCGYGTSDLETLHTIGDTL